MAGKGPLVVLAAAAGLICLFLAAPSEGTITCGQVAGAVASCLGYIRNVAPLTPACCYGVSTLNAAARSTPDRQAACNCLKRFVNLPGLNFQLAGGLPSRCGVNVPYPISPNTDCTRVR